MKYIVRPGKYFNKNQFLKSITFVFCVWLSLTEGKSFGQEIVRTGANNNGVQNGTTENNLTIWAVPAEQKIRPDDRIETKNLIWSKEKNILKVAGAGNEHVPFQIVITDPLPAGRNPRPAAGFFIKASDLVSKQGKRIPENRINFYLEHFMMLTGKSGVTGATGYWPDALAPLKVPVSMAAQYNVI